MSNNIRIEEDLLGTREVPADAYYGVHTLRAIENFYISNNKFRNITDFVVADIEVFNRSQSVNTIVGISWNFPGTQQIFFD
ncbi:hypothetical protein QJN73_25650, partial [Escherichia coli]